MIIDKTIAALKKESPQASNIKEIIVNSGFTGVVLDSGDMGVAMNIRSGGGYGNSPRAPDGLKLIGMNAYEAAQELAEENDFASVSIRVAILNAISHPLMNKSRLEKDGFVVREGDGNHASTFLEASDSVVIIGFGGNVWPISQQVKKVVVSELEPDLFKPIVFNRDGVEISPSRVEIVYSEDIGPYLEEANVVLLTGCALVSGTMESILARSEGKKVIVYGSTASFYPSALFEAGVDVVTTRIVSDVSLTALFLKNCAGTVERFFPQSTRNMAIFKTNLLVAPLPLQISFPAIDNQSLCC